MDYKIVLPLKSLSERKFYEIVQKNHLVDLKYFNSLIDRKSTYLILKRIEFLQSILKKIIFTKECEIGINNQPKIRIKFNISVQIIESPRKEIFAVISCL